MNIVDNKLPGFDNKYLIIKENNRFNYTENCYFCSDIYIKDNLRNTEQALGGKMQTDQIYRDTRIIVDLDQIAANMCAIKEMVGDEVSVMAVVKANAYGLGSLAIAPTLMEMVLAILLLQLWQKQ